MAILYVQRESQNQKAQYVALTQQDKDGNQMIVGSDTGLITAEINHHRLHEGRAFIAWNIYPDSAKLAAGAHADIVLAAGPGTSPHVTIAMESSGDADFFVYEGTTTTGGTAFTPVRRNRNIAATSNVAMVTNPTVNTLGTLINRQFVTGGTGKKSSGGGAGSLEYVLAPLTNYLFRLTNVNGTAHTALLELEWYE
ncbi:hypothetical protein K0U83_08410 [bacterium]|nr:hypothetical protein [bacterium]